MKRSSFLTVIKYILAIAALINLILLFGFHYQIPASIKHRFFKEEEIKITHTSKDTKKKEALNLHFASDILSYDGSASLNLLDGVTVTDKLDQPLDLTIYASIKSTEESTKKIITYTVKDEDGNSASADRTLLLKNYYGPVLTIGQPYPAIYDNELSYIAATFLDNDLLSANDGYGKNITDSIECDYTVTNDTATEAAITFTVTNHFDDKVSETITLPITRTKPLILLKEEAVTISVGESFDPLSHVQSATSERGDNLLNLIKTEGQVDTSTPGTYEITYTLTNRDRKQADPVKLAVTVKES